MTRSYPDDWNRRRKQVYKRDSWTCQSCGRKGRKKGNAELHAHHILPKSEGGSHAVDNLVTLCDRCHAEFHNDQRLLSDSQNQGSLLGRLFYGNSRQEKEGRRRRKKRKAGIKRLRKEARKRKKRSRKQYGSSLNGHLKVFLFTSWWTFGLGNVIYEWWCRSNRTNTEISSENAILTSDEAVVEQQQQIESEKRPRFGKNDQKKGFWQKRVDKGRNQQYGGCPSCDEKSLTVSWLKLEDGSKAKVIECTACSSKYDETDTGLRKIEDVNELDSGKSAFMQELFG